jgi:hypothetical protein
MTPQQLIGTAVRLFAIWLGITSIAYFSSIPAALAAAPIGNGSGVTVAYALGGIYVLAALLLWFFPMVVAQKLVPRTQHTNHLSFRSYELARVGCALLGLWLVSKALPSVVWFLFRSFLFTDAGGSSFSALAPEAKLDVAVSFFELAFAVVVIVKSGAFARLVSPESQAASE